MKLLDFFIKKSIRIENDIFILSEPEENKVFENLYRKVRKKENRILDDSIVKTLPFITKSNQYITEWNIRKKTLGILSNEIKNTNKKQSILDLGCGNGWISNYISKKHNTTVFGIDLNYEELLQAKRVFNENRNLYFIYGNGLDVEFPNNLVDIIIIGSSIQYFPNLEEIIKKLLTTLNEGGFILIFDTKFYSDSQLELVQENTLSYYNKLGIREMSNFYFHHKLDDLSFCIYQIIYNPNTLIRNIIRKYFPTMISPFYFLKIMKNSNY